MTDDAVIAANDLIKDSTYDRLAAWGRRWLPLLSAIFIAIAGIFAELTKVPGLEHIGPWFVALGGIFAAISVGINEFLKRAKELWVITEGNQLADDGVDLKDPDSKSLYYFMTPEQRLEFVDLHPELFPENKKTSEE